MRKLHATGGVSGLERLPIPRWWYRLDRPMAFTLPGFEPWRFQYVMQGRTVLLEALRDDLCLCAILQPLDSVARQAHRLIEASGDILADH